MQSCGPPGTEFETNALKGLAVSFKEDDVFKYI